MPLPSGIAQVLLVGGSQILEDLRPKALGVVVGGLWSAIERNIAQRLHSMPCRDRVTEEHPMGHNTAGFPGVACHKGRRIGSSVAWAERVVAPVPGAFPKRRRAGRL